MNDYLYLKTEIVRNTGSMDAIDDLIDFERKFGRDKALEAAHKLSNEARRTNPVKK